jgi:hypothetical protein
VTCFSKRVVRMRIFLKSSPNAPKCSIVPHLTICLFHYLPYYYNHRSGMVSSLQSTSLWWALVVNDYGTLISSLLALATFASLFFLAYVLHKTLSPKQDTTRPITPEKQKKKKRRGNHHNKGNRSGGRIKGAQQQQQQTKSASVTAVSPEPALESISTKEEMIVQGNENVFSLKTLVEGKPMSPQMPSSVPSPERLIKALKEDTAPSRIRSTSASTADTIATCSDDGTVSERSSPARVILPVIESVPAVSASTLSRADDGLFQPSATSVRKEQSRRGKKHGNVDVSKATHTSDAVPIVPTSRWDALKPDRSVGAGRRVQPKGRTGPQQVVRFHSVQNRPNQQSSPLIKPIARPTIPSPKLAPAEPTHTPIPGSDLVVPREVISPVAASLQSCEIGASTWSQLPTMTYEDRPLTGLLAPFARSPARDSSVAEKYFASPLRNSDQATFFSSELNANTSELNANSPSWLQTNTNIASSAATLPVPSIGSVRAPPGLTLADGGNGLQASFSSQAPSETPFLSTYNGLSVRPCPPFSKPSLVSYNVKENPFDESDNEEDVDQIEAELQELGGQMVGSILDF